MKISISLHHVSFKALVDTKAAGNFMSVKVAQQVKLEMDAGSSVMVASSAYQSSYIIYRLVPFSIHQFIFCDHFLAMPNLVFLVTLGVGWWRRQHVKIHLEINTLSFTNDDSKGEFPLINTLKKIQKTSSITTLVTSASIPANFPKSLMQYWRIFDMEKADRLPKHTRFNCGFQTTVELVNINCLLYPHTAEEEIALNTWLDDMLKKGWLFKETSPVASPIIFAKKFDGSLCPCMDYRHLNKITVSDLYPLPLEQTISQAIAKSCVFSKLDLVNAFNQIQVMEGQEWLTMI